MLCGRTAKPCPRRVATSLANWGIQSENLSKLNRPLPENARARFAFLFNSVAIALQRHAGHKVYRAKRSGPQGICPGSRHI